MALSSSRAAAYHLAQRWPDVLVVDREVAACRTRPTSIDDLTAAVDTLAAAAAASLGQFQTALDRAATVDDDEPVHRRRRRADEGLVPA